MSELWIATILGIVEGVTEFLPVSSTGHLILVGSLLGFSGERASSFQVAIQLGAILAVGILYMRRFTALIPRPGISWATTQNFAGLKGILLLVTTCIPAVVLGAFAHKTIKAYLFHPLPVAAALGLGGIGILLVERFKPEAVTRDLDDMNFKQALAVGCFQCLSLWPGVSRAAATILGGMLWRMDRSVAAEYSFLAAVPIMIAAVGYDLYKESGYLQASDLPVFAVGFVVSFVSAAIAVKLFVGMLQRWSLAPFAVYRILAAPLLFFYWSK